MITEGKSNSASTFFCFLDDIMDFEAVQLRAGTHNGPLVARVATKVSQELVAL